MRRALRFPIGLSLVLLSALFLASACRSRPARVLSHPPPEPPAAFPPRTSATELPRPWEVGPNARVSTEPTERRAAPADDPFGLWMVEVLVLDEEGRPIQGAQVTHVRGGDKTNAAGRAWVPPLGLDMGSPTRDRRYKTLRVGAPGFKEEERWAGMELGSVHVFRLRRDR